MKSISIISIILFSINVYADFGVYKLPITRNGVTKTKVAYNSWSGEYPFPVVKVLKNTTIAGVKSLRDDQSPKRQCTIAKGIYHPWAKSPSSLINFYTISNAVTAKAKTDINGDSFWYDNSGAEVKVKSSEVIDNIIYYAEGFCGGTHLSNAQEKAVSFDCSTVFDNESFEVISEDKSFDEGEQWIHLQCAEGHQVFVQDIKLLNQKYVVEGEIADYGEVK